LNDVNKLYQFYNHDNTSLDLCDINASQIKEFVYQMAEIIEPATQSRLLSGLRMFFKYLMLENEISHNPMELIESPKISRKLPDVLSVEEIDKMIAAIDLSSPEGERNRTIIETLYGCGLRVSELVNLHLSDLFFEEGFIKVTGKGDKQRFVPISDYTQKYINIYRDHIRTHQIIHPDFEDVLFLNRRGKQLTRVMIFYIIKDLIAKANINKKISPHSLRHRFTFYSIVIRTRKYYNYRNLSTFRQASTTRNIEKIPSSKLIVISKI